MVLVGANFFTYNLMYQINTFVSTYIESRGVCALQVDQLPYVYTRRLPHSHSRELNYVPLPSDYRVTLPLPRILRKPVKPLEWCGRLLRRDAAARRSYAAGRSSCAIIVIVGGWVANCDLETARGLEEASMWMGDAKAACLSLPGAFAIWAKGGLEAVWVALHLCSFLGGLEDGAASCSCGLGIV